MSTLADRKSARRVSPERQLRRFMLLERIVRAIMVANVIGWILACIYLLLRRAWPYL